MDIVVQKYGGSSVATVDKIKAVADKIIKKYNENKKVVVVLSAMGDSTNNLIDLASQISKEPNSREMDVLLSTGEQVTISLLAMALIEKGYDAISFTGYQLNIKTSGDHQSAKISDIDITKVVEKLDEGKIVVVAGFQGILENGEFSTLGRGGSDTSAVALAAKLDARCEIYTDVEGIYTMDPRRLKNAKKLKYISYEEMIELADLGAKVLNFRSVLLASKYNVPMYVASTFSDEIGTLITDRELGNLEETVITGMSVNQDDIQITVLNLPSSSRSLSDLFMKIGKGNVNVDMISQMITKDKRMNVSFSISGAHKDTVINILKGLKEEDNLLEWETNENISKVSVVGLGMKTNVGVAGKVFELMAENDIEIKMITTSETRITWMICGDREQEAIDLIGAEFELQEKGLDD